MATETVSIDLPSGTIYVTGTVNGVSKTWTNTHDNVWATTADKSDDDKYVLVMTLINGVGIVTEATLTLYYGMLTLITDRTQADADRAETLAAKDYNAMTDAEKAEWDSDLKGAYNYSDLNRVESAVYYLANQLIQLDSDLRDYADSIGVAWDKYFDLPYSTTEALSIANNVKTVWADSDIPAAADMLRYLDNVKRLVAMLEADYPELPAEMADLAYTAANNIEQALLILLDAIGIKRDAEKHEMDNTAANFLYSGEIYTNEV